MATGIEDDHDFDQFESTPTMSNQHRCNGVTKSLHSRPNENDSTQDLTVYQNKNLIRVIELQKGASSIGKPHLAKTINSTTLTIDQQRQQKPKVADLLIADNSDINDSGNRGDAMGEKELSRKNQRQSSDMAPNALLSPSPSSSSSSSFFSLSTFPFLHTHSMSLKRHHHYPPTPTTSSSSDSSFSFQQATKQPLRQKENKDRIARHDSPFINSTETANKSRPKTQYLEHPTVITVNNSTQRNSRSRMKRCSSGTNSRPLSPAASPLASLFDRKQRTLSTPALPSLMKTIVSTGAALPIYSIRSTSSYAQHNSHDRNFESYDRRMKYYSLQLPLNEGLSNAFSSTSLNNEDDWDPHIDTFEILKAKLSNITRSMQEFQVEALISNKHCIHHEEIASCMETTQAWGGMLSPPLSSSCIETAPSISLPLLNTTSPSSSSSSSGFTQRCRHRRFSLANVPKSFDNGNNINSSSSNDGRHENNHHKQHRRRSQSQNPDALRTLSISHDDNDDKDSIFLHHRLSNLYRTHSNVSSTIFSTTHSLIHSRLDELSETASIRSSLYINNTEDKETAINDAVVASSTCLGLNSSMTDSSSRSHGNDQSRIDPSSSGTEELLAWQNQFVNLISNCINHSEALESLSTDLLRTEDRVRGLLLLQEAVQDQLAEYEKHYEQRIRLLQKVTQEQLALIDALGTLTAEIDQLKGQQRVLDEKEKEKKKETLQRRRDKHRHKAFMALNKSSAIHSDDLRNENEETDEIQDEDEDEDEDDDTRSASYDSRLCGTRQLLWNTNQNAFNVLELQNKHEELQQLRWEVGMLLDGMIGTGRRNDIHFTPHQKHLESSRDDGRKISTLGNRTVNSSCSDDTVSAAGMLARPSTSNVITNVQLPQLQYTIELTHKDRLLRFVLLPKEKWRPDHETNQCQFIPLTQRRRCKTLFTFLQRKHHCRRCGIIVCQHHSSNQLPLFEKIGANNAAIEGQWSRVCDNCFYALIIQQKK